MQLRFWQLVAAVFISSAFYSRAATFYVDLNSPAPTPPYSTWATAATNIEDAINASSDGDQIWVTNGVYRTGGVTKGGVLTNRVTLNKAVTVQSVNGPFVTAIEGAGASNGFPPVRCAWLTNNASLIGFTLAFGMTGSGGDDQAGGVWCASSNSLVMNCLIVSNSAFYTAAAAFHGTLENCLVAENSGATEAVESANLYNCTVINNANDGILDCHATNSIIYNNAVDNSFLSHCVVSDPQLFPGTLHPCITSPCLRAGTNAITATDIYGDPWGSPPSIGCAEVSETPFVGQPQFRLTSVPVGFAVNALISASGPLGFNWLKDGVLLQDNGHFSSTQTSNLVATGVTFADAGAYQLIVSNASGTVTGAVAQLVMHCVDAAGAKPVAPYTNWTTAATNIQDAITSASPQGIVLVTNGLYATGGNTFDGLITNHISINKPILVQSVNGPTTTAIQGAPDPVSTNGPAAVRCVWMTNGSILNGFTLSGGATREASNTFNPSMAGGGVCGSIAPGTNPLSNGAVAWNCVIGTNSGSHGAGAYSLILYNCSFIGNHLFNPPPGTIGGAGAAECYLRNCLLESNSCDQIYGGGTGNCYATNCAYLNNRAFGGSAINTGIYVNCTVVNNTSTYTGSDPHSGAVMQARLNNCIVYGNFASSSSGPTNYDSYTGLDYSDSDPLPGGLGNIDANPQLLPDNIHLASTSPCIGAGTNSVVSGTDIDGQPWKNPPSMGCDEWYPAPVVLQSAGALNNYFQFNFFAETNATYIVQYTTNLTPPTPWQTLQTFSHSPGGVLTVQDPSATNQQRFYRVGAQ